MKFHLKLIISAFNKFIFIEKPECTGFSHRIMIINIQAIYNMFAECKFFLFDITCKGIFQGANVCWELFQFL